MMKHIDALKFALLIVFLIVVKSVAQAHELPLESQMNQDSLVLEKNTSDKQAVIQSGEKIKVWLSNNTTEKGEFTSILGDTLRMMNSGLEKTIPINEIKKLKVYAGPTGKIIGGVFVVVGAGSMFFGGLSLAAGLIALMADDLGVIILFAVPVLLGGGYGVLGLGKRIRGKKFKINTKWHIQVNPW